MEIGYYKGWSFDNVKCNFKVAIDPNPCKTEEQESFPIDAKLVWCRTNEATSIITESEEIFKTTSDTFFSGKDAKTYDIIFIDGDHHSEQVWKDIQNSMKHLSEGGIIVMHDCNPPTEQHTTTGVDGCWTGDVYKAVLEFRDHFEGSWDFYCVDTDWGVGVIQKLPKEEEFDLFQPFTHGFVMMDKGKYDAWKAFDRHRKNMLTLIPVDEFLRRINETVKDNFSTAQ